MKILHIVESTATGTLAMVMLLANAQNKHGHEVYVIYSRRPESPENISDGFDSDVIMKEEYMNTFFNKFLSIFSLRNHIKLIDPENVFLHSSAAGFLGRLSALFLSSQTRFYYIPHCISFMRKDIGLVSKTIFIALEMIASTKKCIYLACSKSELDLVKKYLPLSTCILLENSAQLDVVVDTQYPRARPEHEEFTVVTAGQIRTQKNPTLFASICRETRTTHPNVRFIWLGDGDHHFRNELIDSGVEVKGWMTKDAVIEHMSTSDVYLSTASWEGLPISLVEAFLCGLPVVASSCTGNIDVIKHRFSGLLYDNDAEAVNFILEIIESSTLGKRITRNALLEARTRFSLDRYIEDVKKLN